MSMSRSWRKPVGSSHPERLRRNAGLVGFHAGGEYGSLSATAVTPRRQRAMSGSRLGALACLIDALFCREHDGRVTVRHAAVSRAASVESTSSCAPMAMAAFNNADTAPVHGSRSTSSPSSSTVKAVEPVHLRALSVTHLDSTVNPWPIGDRTGPAPGIASTRL